MPARAIIHFGLLSRARQAAIAETFYDCRSATETARRLHIGRKTVYRYLHAKNDVDALLGVFDVWHTYRLLEQESELDGLQLEVRILGKILSPQTVTR